jgi:hypothetical protein
MRFSMKLGLTRIFKAETTVYLIRVYLTESSVFKSIPPPPNDAAAHIRPGSHYRGFTVTLRHTTFGRTPLDEWSARRWDLYLTTHNTHNRRTSMPPAGFEPTIPASERPQTHALERGAIGSASHSMQCQMFGWLWIGNMEAGSERSMSSDIYLKVFALINWQNPWKIS